MKLEYENKFSDLLLFNAIHQFLSPVLQGFYLLLTFLIAWAGYVQRQELAPAVMQAIIIFLAMWILQFVFNILYLYSKKNRSVLTRHIVEIQGEAFYEETLYNKSYFYWNRDMKAVRRPGFVAFYISPYMAHIVPKRAFSSAAQLDDFLRECRSRIAKAKD